MGMWTTYEERMSNSGLNLREETLRREKHMLCNKLTGSLSYHDGVLIDGLSRNVAIINSDNLNEKHIYSLPGEDIKNGSMVKWMNNYWLVTERDANCEVYTKAKMIQCNYLLKWVEVVNDEPIVMEQWCIVDDGTKSGLHKALLGILETICKKYSPIAGTSLEPYRRNRIANSYIWNGAKMIRIGQSAAKPRIEERSTTMFIGTVGASAPKRGALNHVCGMEKI